MKSLTRKDSRVPSAKIKPYCLNRHNAVSRVTPHINGKAVNVPSY